MLDQGPPLEQGDLGHVGADVDADQVPAHRLAPALPAASAPAARALGRSSSAALGRRTARPLRTAPALALPGCRGAPPAPAARAARRAPRPSVAAAPPAPAGCPRSCGLGRWGAGRGRVGGASASRRLPGGTLRGLADFHLGHEGKPSSRTVFASTPDPGPAHREGLEPSAVAFDPLMRSTGPSEHRTGAEGRYQVARADATRMRGQLRPRWPSGPGHGQSQDGRADVVVGLTTLPLPPDRENGSSEHPLHPLLQLLTWHSEHLQLPIARCYLLLQRSLGFCDQGGGLHLDPLGQQRAERPGSSATGELTRLDRTRGARRGTRPATRSPWAGPARSSPGGAARSPASRPPGAGSVATPAPTCGPRPGGS